MLFFRHRAWSLRFTAFAALALALVAPSPSAWAELKVPTAASLSFAEKHYLGSQGRWMSEYRDLLTGYNLTIAEGPGPGVREETVVNSGGNQVYHSEIHPNWRRTEGLIPKPWSSEVHALSDGRYFVVRMQAGPDGRYETSESIEGAEIWKSCDKPAAVVGAQFELLLNSAAQLVPLVADPADAGKDTVHLGSNTIAKNCAKYPPSGVDSLIKAMSEALDTGLRCLANLVKTHKGPLTAMWRMSAAQLLGYFVTGAPHPFTVVCERTDTASTSPEGVGAHMSKDPAGQKSTTMALALTCKDGKPELGGAPEDYPGMALNLAGPHINEPDQMVGTIFHEMLHHLGLDHNVDPKKKNFFDAVYGAEFCCFPATLSTNDPKLSDFECDEIANKPHGSAH